MSPPDPTHRRRQARRTVMIGLLVFLACAALTFSPLLLGRGGINRFLVAFGLMGVFIGASFILHGGWDWLRSGRSR